MTVKNHARIVAFHDINHNYCTDVAKVWSRIKEYMPSNKIIEFSQQYTEVFSVEHVNHFGIGVVEF